MLEIKKEFSQRELLWFGPLFAIFTGLIVSILVRRFHLNQTAVAISSLAAVLIAVYYAVPAWRKNIYIGWMFSVAPIGWVISHVLLALLYYLVVTPIGLIMRCVGYDPMQRKIEHSADTYWVRRSQSTDADRYFRQF